MHVAVAGGGCRFYLRALLPSTLDGCKGMMLPWLAVAGKN